MATVLTITTGRDGALVDGARDAVDAIFRELEGAPKVVLHFHGGLVSRASGEETARRQDKVYRQAGAVPVFFIWQSDLIRTVQENLSEIAGEDLFKSVLKWVLKYAVGKINEADGLGGRGLGLQTPNDTVIYTELAKRDAGKEPFAGIQPAGPVSDLTDEEREELERALAEDPAFAAAVASIEASLLPAPIETGSRGVTERVRAAGTTLLSPSIVEEIRTDAAAARAAGEKGLITSVAMIRHAVAVLYRVVKRFIQRRDHGLYPTVVEELLRELYVANAGVAIWRVMKGDTADTFSAKQPPRGGYYFAQKLNALLATARPEITLVGHSTGAVFIGNMLKHLEALRRIDPPGFPNDYAIKNVVFLAPACTFDDFARYVVAPYISSGGSLYESFRMYTMTDRAECNDSLVRGVYTRSLLYFISGVLEPGDDGRSAPDVPVVGLERYYRHPEIYDQDSVAVVRDFVAGGSSRAVWSPTDAAAPPGMQSGALKHGDFDNDPVTDRSLIALIGG